MDERMNKASIDVENALINLKAQYVFNSENLTQAERETIIKLIDKMQDLNGEIYQIGAK